MEEQNDKEGFEFKGIKLPAKTILPTHKLELKKALFELKPTNKPLILEVIESIPRRVIFKLGHILSSRQPVWRMALIVLALVLVTGLSVMLPSLFGQDEDAMATESEIMQILKSDSRTKALLDDGAIVSFLEEDYTGDKWMGGLIAIVEDAADTTIIAYEIDITIIAQRMLVEIALGDKYYMADVDVNNRKVLSFGEKGDPDFRTIAPRFDIDIRGETLNDEGERTPIAIGSSGSRGFEGIESYIDPLYKDKISFFPSFIPADIDDESLPIILE